MSLAFHVRVSSGVLLLFSGLAGVFAADEAGEKERNAGRELFARVWVPNDSRAHGGDGLGPVFNAQSCLGCHDRGGPGGAGTVERNIDIVTVTGSGFGGGSQGFAFAYSFGMDFSPAGFDYRLASPPTQRLREPALDPAVLAAIHPGFRAARSVVLHRFGTDPAYHPWRDKVPGQHGSLLVRTSQRNPTPLFGAGLIDAIPDEVIEAASKRKLPGLAKIKGRVSRQSDGRVGRFGWKAQTATLREFVLSAAATEVGLEVADHHQAADPRLPGLGSPGLDLDDSECNALVAYVRGLPAPVARVPADAAEAAQMKAGEATFKAIGCAVCHLPKLGDVDGIYSDLLLHDMSPKLSDTGAYGVFVTNPAGAGGPAASGGPRGEGSVATLQEWRTPPLWGLRDSAPYLHDGRAATVEQAITLHGGQGSGSAQRFGQLSNHRKRQLEAFLLSLTAPPRDDERFLHAQAD